MKKVGWFFLAIFMCRSLTAQPPTLLLIAKGKGEDFLVEIKDSSAQVSRLRSILDKAGTAPLLVADETLTYNGNSYIGTRYQLQPSASVILLHDEQGKKSRYLELDTVVLSGTVNEWLNEAYWWQRVLLLDRTLEQHYPLLRFSFREGFARWRTMNEKTMDHFRFRKKADQMTQDWNDSLMNIETSNEKLAIALLSSLPQISYDRLKEGILHLQKYQDQRHFGILVNAVALQRPEHFFDLADEGPELRHAMFITTYRTKERKRKLRAVATDSPSKKTYFKNY